MNGFVKRSWSKKIPRAENSLRFNRNRRNEIAEDAFDRVRRAAPDAEKSKNVVNAERVEIISHLREPLLPPRETVGGHARPVVSREAPVLALRGEGIRRRAGLQVHVKQLRLLPRIRAVPIHANGEVALQNESGGMHMRRRAPELQMQMILNEKVECDFVVAMDQRGDFGRHRILCVPATG